MMVWMFIRGRGGQEAPWGSPVRDKDNERSPILLRCFALSPYLSNIQPSISGRSPTLSRRVHSAISSVNDIRHVRSTFTSGVVLWRGFNINLNIMSSRHATGHPEGHGRSDNRSRRTPHHASRGDTTAHNSQPSHTNWPTSPIGSPEYEHDVSQNAYDALNYSYYSMGSSSAYADHDVTDPTYTHPSSTSYHFQGAYTVVDSVSDENDEHGKQHPDASPSNYHESEPETTSVEAHTWSSHYCRDPQSPQGNTHREAEHCDYQSQTEATPLSPDSSRACQSSTDYPGQDGDDVSTPMIQPNPHVLSDPISGTSAAVLTGCETGIPLELLAAGLLGWPHADIEGVQNAFEKEPQSTVHHDFAGARPYDDRSLEPEDLDLSSSYYSAVSRMSPSPTFSVDASRSSAKADCTFYFYGKNETVGIAPARTLLDSGNQLGPMISREMIRKLGFRTEDLKGAPSLFYTVGSKHPTTTEGSLLMSYYQEGDEATTSCSFHVVTILVPRYDVLMPMDIGGDDPGDPTVIPCVGATISAKGKMKESDAYVQEQRIREHDAEGSKADKERASARAAEKEKRRKAKERKEKGRFT
ncbi:hypothetical protein QBC35DRAFT_34912 [Podospora australis]|uniref:Uncharacterized protein n=1 Tax=Podospora australis TaxID=1536484 RepID=A0AAN6WZF1_9PEZI|nr:hypothetical protein QBC35DRAFT_34912 [Podospora australis]